MRIDIHTHTKKVKQGDSEHRNIDVEKFEEIIKETDVRILAITNHNHFDYEQYIEFKEKVEVICQIWPGVEFDILEGGRKAHLILIVNPKKAEEFKNAVFDVLGTSTPDTFSIGIDELVRKFDNLDVIYIAHYYSKSPNLTDNDLEKILSLVNNQKRVLKEASNSISAGIYIKHGHNSIHGSDVQNWNDYLNISKSLPELRLPVESFEQFCLLLDKDDATIKTLLDKKSKESIQINPFGVAELLNIDIYNDINILFGSKGTGKTEILKALSNYYNGIGFKTEVYESSSKRLDEVYDIKGNFFNIDAESLGLDNCSTEFTELKNASEKNVTSISAFLRYYSAEVTNKISKSIKIDKFTQLDENSAERSFKEAKNIFKLFQDFKDYFNSDDKLKSIIGEDLFEEYVSIINKIIEKVHIETENKHLDYKSINFFNNLIKIFVAEISRKTGQPEKPIKTGFYDYARKRIQIEKNATKILKNIAKPIAPQIEYVGDLGEKGKLYCTTNITIQNGKVTDAKYKHVLNTTKIPQKSVAAQIELISKHIYSNELFEKISELNAIESSENVNSIDDLLLFYRHFTLNAQVYTPSNGESSMVLLHNELSKDKEIYLIDEPEKSLGNDYISDVIVPLIKERARSGKRIIIATHDANIAVRTLPYHSIYRAHDIYGYYTYSGNPFSNNLICITGQKPNLDWKYISMKTLEGGKSAFGERGKIYGNT